MECKADILLIDDEAGLQELVCAELGRRGYRVVSALSGEEGVGKIKDRRFDIILLDMKLPGMDGARTLEEARRLDPEAEIIIITGHGSLQSAVETLKKGAADYIEKPVVLERLIGAIETVLRQHNLKETVLLYETSKAIFSTIDLDKLLKIIMDLTMRVLRADDVSVMLFNEQKELYIAISSGLSENIQKQTRLALGERVAGWAAQSKEPVILINGLWGDSRFKGIEGRGEIKSALVIPLLRNNEVIGVLNANRMQISENFSRSDLYKAKIFISLVSLALDNAGLHAAAKKARETLAKKNEELASGERRASERLAELEKTHEDLKTAQRRLIQAERLSSLGRLVSEMAHEVNNPLMVISGRAQLCLMKDALNAEVKRSLEIISGECSRAKEIILRLLKFSRARKAEAREVNITESIEAVAALIEHQFGLSDIRIKRNYSADLPPLVIDEKQMQEVFINILNNARDAMPEGGAIEISVLEKGGFLYISFKDSGRGMPDSVKDKLFEPFFTTKEKGTGLGLSVCYGIVKAHGGELELESEQGKGTEALIRLPVKGE